MPAPVTLYTDLKLAQGGKGFGRFTCLKYFGDVFVDSTFLSSDGHKRRTFKMGKDTEIIVNEEVESADGADIGSKVTLSRVKENRFQDKQLTTIARSVVERLLPYFIDEEHGCPKITIAEADGSDRIVLNDFVDNELAALIKEVPLTSNAFTLDSLRGDSAFTVRLFKIYSPRNQTVVSNASRADLKHLSVPESARASAGSRWAGSPTGSARAPPC